jgi:SAM-dependent methyltransferase
VARRVRGKEPELKGSVGAPDVGAIAHYEDPDYYDVAYRSRHDDVAYYVRLGRLSGGPVLEYGVGTGRIALPLARAGVEVTGVDLSAPMLAHLEKKLEAEPADVRRRVRAVRADMRTARLRRRFPLVIAAFNTVLHLLERRDFEQFLSGVKSHLAPGGQLVFDFSVPHPDYLGADPRRRFGHPRFRHPKRGLVKYGERFDYDPLRQVLTMKLEFEPVDGSAPWVVPLTHRQFFPLEMESLLHYNGFGDIEWSSDFTDSPADHETDSLVVSCRPVPARAARPSRGRRPAHGSRARASVG